MVCFLLGPFFNTSLHMFLSKRPKCCNNFGELSFFPEGIRKDKSRYFKLKISFRSSIFIFFSSKGMWCSTINSFMTEVTIIIVTVHWSAQQNGFYMIGTSVMKESTKKFKIGKSKGTRKAQAYVLVKCKICNAITNSMFMFSNSPLLRAVDQSVT